MSVFRVFSAVLSLAVLSGGALITSVGPASFKSLRDTTQVASLQALYVFDNAACQAPGSPVIPNVVDGSSLGGLAVDESDSYFGGVGGTQDSDCPDETVAFGGSFTYPKSMNGIRLEGTRRSGSLVPFNGVIGVPTPADYRDSSDTFSIEVWFTPAFSMSGGTYSGGPSSGDEFVIAEFGEPLSAGDLTGGAYNWLACTNYGLRISIANALITVSYCGNNGGTESDQSISVAAALTQGNLHQIVVTIDNTGSGNLEIYLDGAGLTFPSALVVGGSFAFIFDASYESYIGSSPATLSTTSSLTTHAFLGDINMVAIYKTELSATEVEDLYDESIANSAPVARDATIADLTEDDTKTFSKISSSVFYYDEDFNLRPTLSPTDMVWQIPAGNLPTKGTLLLNNIDVSTLTLPATGAELKYEQSTAHQFSPAADDDFDYQICDETGACSAVETLSVRITPVNDDPVAELTTASVAEGRTVPISLSYSDVDCGGNNQCASVAGFVEPTGFFPQQARITSFARDPTSTFNSVFGTLYEYDYGASECTTTEITTFDFIISPTIVVGERPEFIVCYYASSEAASAPMPVTGFEVGKDIISFEIDDGFESSGPNQVDVTVTNVLAVGASPLGTVSDEQEVDEDKNATFFLVGTDNKCEVGSAPPGCPRTKRFKIIGLPRNAIVYHNEDEITSLPYPPGCNTGAPLNCIDASDNITVVPQANFNNLAQYPQCSETNTGFFRSKCVPGRGELSGGVGDRPIPCVGTKCGGVTQFTMNDMNNITLGNCGGEAEYLGGCPEELRYTLIVNGGESPTETAEDFPGTVVWFKEVSDPITNIVTFEKLTIPSSVLFDVGNLSFVSPDGDNEIIEVTLLLQSGSSGANENLNIRFAQMRFAQIDGAVFEDVRPCTFDCTDLTNGKQFRISFNGSPIDCRNGCTTMTLTGIVSAINFALAHLQYTHSDSSELQKTDVITLTYRVEGGMGVEIGNAGQSITNGNEIVFRPSNSALGQAQLIAIIAAASAALLMCCISICTRIYYSTSRCAIQTKEVLARFVGGLDGEKQRQNLEDDMVDRTVRAAQDHILHEHAVIDKEEKIVRTFCYCCLTGDFQHPTTPFTSYEAQDELSTHLQHQQKLEEANFDLVAMHKMMQWDLDFDMSGKRVGYTHRQTGEKVYDRPRLIDGSELRDDSIFQWRFIFDPQTKVSFYHNVSTGEARWTAPPIKLKNGKLIQKRTGKKQKKELRKQHQQWRKQNERGPPPKPQMNRGPPPNPIEQKKLAGDGEHEKSYSTPRPPTAPPPKSKNRMGPKKRG